MLCLLFPRRRRLDDDDDDDDDVKESADDDGEKTKMTLIENANDNRYKVPAGELMDFIVFAFKKTPRFSKTQSR